MPGYSPAKKYSMRPRHLGQFCVAGWDASTAIRATDPERVSPALRIRAAVQDAAGQADIYPLQRVVEHGGVNFCHWSSR
jgi:hypothetical protein